ncbi:succinate--hydroxymethylglutarate CoA-transferase-like [Dreissena polymorpha]|uniref:Succinate--hydroxymethylglutarate CoA-transferase n=1 Tax=Dreissena polymorpha TaxID=45954 RepID=A0A9D4QVN3_DREPO|nr:succinate--hydroxymethylglutarate CoA-transferase-like [Dreissena polymorpha]KAH3843885.1 hypothetical protein DPMN_117418 [Dreissena polymorpha]
MPRPCFGHLLQHVRKCALCSNNGHGSRLCRRQYLAKPRLYSTTVDEKDVPLNRVRVLDLSRILAGPYCSMLLGDLGAEVIKIEKPGVGDDTRSWGPPFCGTESAYFLSVNRNKKSICVDLKRPEGQDIIKELAKKSDVLIENFVPGKLTDMGLGFEQMSRIAPHLVYCSITGYGHGGPDASRPGYDVIVAATAGLTHITGPEDGEPCKVGVAMTDLSTGLYAHGAILAALLHRRKTGRGQHIDCNLLSTQVASLVNIASNFLNAGQEAKRWGTAHASIVPYQAFKTSDGYVLVGAGNDGQFVDLCKRVGLEELTSVPDYKTNQKRVENRVKLVAIFSDKFRSKSTSEWLDTLRGSHCPYGPINNMAQVFSDPQVVNNELLQEMTHPTAGTVRVAGPAVRYSETPTVLKHPPPTLGQHTREVLQSLLSLSDEEVIALKIDGVVA